MDELQRESWLQSRKKRKSFDARKLAADLFSGNRQALGTAITLVESSNLADRKKAIELLALAKTAQGNSIRIGITGVPGVGKSSFIEAFGMYLLQAGKRVAVLAVDPSSTKNKGSILGDKTRMNILSMQENVFIRPSPSGGTLGGLARSTNESILICEAAGYDVILVETVGVGQSETMVKQSVDFFLLLMLSGAGDELQGIKRGIMELADLLVITKADGDNIQAAKRAAAEYKNALHLFPPNENQWVATAATCSAQDQKGLKEVWEKIESFVNSTKVNGWFDKNRREQQVFWLERMVQIEILERISAYEDFHRLMKNAEESIFGDNDNAFVLAQNIVNEIFEKYLNNNPNGKN
jgi:LAO/AO transport system kinase